MSRTTYGPKLPVPLSMAVGTEYYVFVSGQVGSAPDGSFPASIEEQTQIAVDKLGALLAEAGSSFDKVVKTTVFLTDMNEFAGMNRVYAKVFGESPPARSTIGCQLVGAARVEIEVTALR